MSLELEVLKILIDRHDYVSGSEIARNLGVSRSTIHKLIDSLRSKGFIIEAHPKYGYRLVDIDDLSKVSDYVKDLSTNLKFTTYFIEQCTSTQDVAESLASQGAPEGLVVISNTMIMGRGRLGRRWYASQGGLWFTIILRPTKVRSLHLLNLVAGIAIVKALKNILNMDTYLKWPNDVLYNDKKLCGILVEVRAEADVIRYVLLGIGINVNNDLPEHLKATAVTLKELLGHPVPRIPLLRAVLKNLDMGYELLVIGEGVKVVKLWKNYSGTLGKYVKVITSEGAIEGYAVDVDVDGALIVEVGGGRREVVYSGDVIHLKRRDLSA